MSKARKAKWNIEENTREGYTRYSIRKYSMGVASVAVLSGFFFLTGISAQAAEIVAPQIPGQANANTITSTKEALSKEAKVEKATEEKAVVAQPVVTATPTTTATTREAKVGENKPKQLLQLQKKKQL